MKAAILNKMGEAPKYGEFPSPKVQNEEQLIMDVSASALKNLDKLMATAYGCGNGWSWNFRER